MAVKLVTCPETAHLEEIEYELHPLGLLISSCSGLQCVAYCARTCAARLDRRLLADHELEPEEEDTQVDVLCELRL